MKTHCLFKNAVPQRCLAAPLLAALLVATVTTTTLAQTSPARGPRPADTQMPMEDYLGLLRQIAPAAETGARQYLATIRLRCARSLDSSELRLALSQTNGNPQLLELIRASHLRDDGARKRLVRQIQCPQGTNP